jgi:hypothetical protein
MNNTLPTASSTDALALLPKTKEMLFTEKLFHLGALGILVVLGIKFVVPVVTTMAWKLGSLLNSLTGLVGAALGFGVVVYGTPLVWKVGTMFLDTLAERATYAIIKYDPVARLNLWYEEVIADGEEFADQIQNLEGVTEFVRTREEEARLHAADAEERAKGLALGDPHFEAYAYEVDTYTAAANGFRDELVNLETLSGELEEVYGMYKGQAQKLKVDIELTRSRWEVAGIIKGATQSAEKLLLKNSELRKQGEEAARYITQRHAAEIGRMKSLKKLSAGMIAAFKADQGSAAKKLLEKWKQEKQQLTVIPASTVPTPVSEGGAYASILNDNK